ncbi:MAG TPA: hypothetical protein VIT42_04890 [Microlunatus sp.]
MRMKVNQSRPVRVIRLATVGVTGLLAASAYAGAVGLLGGGLSFGESINVRLPFGSLGLAGLALLMIVAGPMTVAAVAVARGARRSCDLVFAAGLLLVAWIGIQLAFIQVYSWFHPTYLAAAFVVLGLGWLLVRTDSAAGGGSAADGRETTTPRTPTREAA